MSRPTMTAFRKADGAECVIYESDFNDREYSRTAPKKRASKKKAAPKKGAKK